MTHQDKTQEEATHLPASIDNKLDSIGARQFWSELCEAFDSLTELAEFHGARTLADLMYLQNAILSGGFIDHYPGESRALEIVNGLPSGDRWTTYVKVEYLASPVT